VLDTFRQLSISSIANVTLYVVSFTFRYGFVLQAMLTVLFISVPLMAHTAFTSLEVVSVVDAICNELIVRNEESLAYYV
jgi:hypothetical protein